MKQFDKKFADKYINEQLEIEKEVEKKAFYDNMDDYDKMLHNIKNTPKNKHPDVIDFFLKCNLFEKIMLMTAQLGACAIPFTMLAAFGRIKSSVDMALVTGYLWLTCLLCLIALGVSRKIRFKEKFSISIFPTFKI